MEAEAPVLMVMTDSIWLSHKTKVAMVVLTAMVALAVTDGSNYCQESKLSQR